MLDKYTHTTCEVSIVNRESSPLSDTGTSEPPHSPCGGDAPLLATGQGEYRREFSTQDCNRMFLRGAIVQILLILFASIAIGWAVSEIPYIFSLPMPVVLQREAARLAGSEGNKIADRNVPLAWRPL